MSDLISRQAAIRLITGYNGVVDKSVAKRLIAQMPSRTARTETGKWIYGENEYGIDGYHCDKCGFFVPWDYIHKFINYIEDYNFCPNCGAQMIQEGENNERA